MLTTPQQASPTSCNSHPAHTDVMCVCVCVCVYIYIFTHTIYIHTYSKYIHTHILHQDGLEVTYTK